jgi:hypothetical protein
MNHCKILHPSKTYLPAVQIQIPWNCCKILHPSKIYLFKAPSLNVIKYQHSHKFVAGERRFSKIWPFFRKEKQPRGGWKESEGVE